MKPTRLLMVMLTLFVATIMQAQQITCKGNIADVSGEPIIGASVVVKGTSQGTVSDLDGNFTIQANPNTTLVVSYIGYVTQEVKASDKLKITLKEDSRTLEDVVVVGYGVQKKSVVTASIAKVSADDLDGKATVRVDNALKGLASGVTVTSSSGQPGAASQVRIRGIGTINNSNPLYIVDGMPIEGGIDYLNPSDIESIEVLKDAASGAIYGTRAANGVILVTTKGGGKGSSTRQLQLLLRLAEPMEAPRCAQRHRVCCDDERRSCQRRTGSYLCRSLSVRQGHRLAGRSVQRQRRCCQP